MTNHWNRISLLNFYIKNLTFEQFFSGLNYKTKVLNIGNSSLSEIDFLENLLNLVKLNISKNRIRYLKKKYFISKKLQILILNENSNLIEIEKNQQIFFNSLLFLQLTLINILRISFENLKNLKNLKTINLSSSSFDNFDGILFKNLVTLEIFDIRKINLLESKKTFRKEQFKNFYSIKEVYSSEYRYCCYVREMKKLRFCLPKKLLDVSSCGNLIPSIILEGKLKVKFIY